MQGQGDIPMYGQPQSVLPGRERIPFPLDSHGTGPRSGVLLGFSGANGPSFPMDAHNFPGYLPNRDQLYGTTAMPNFSMLQTMNKGGGGDAAVLLPHVNGKENEEPSDIAIGGVGRQEPWNKMEPGGQRMDPSVQPLHSGRGPGFEGGPLPLSQRDADMMEHVRAKQHTHMMSQMHQLQAWQREQQELLLRQQMEQLARIRQEQEKMKSLLVAQRTGHWGGEIKTPSSPKSKSPTRSRSDLSPSGSRQPLSPSHRPWSSRSPPRSNSGSSPSRPRSTLPDALARASMSPRRLAQSFLPQDYVPQENMTHDQARQSRIQAPVPAPTDSDVGSVMDDGAPVEMEGVFPLPETASEMEDDQSEDHIQAQGKETDSNVITTPVTPPSSRHEDSSSNNSQGTPEDERPIKPLSAGRPKTFEQLLEEKLHLEESKKDAENADEPKQKAVKRPFLRKGQGLARFGVIQNRTAGKTFPFEEDSSADRNSSLTGRPRTAAGQSQGTLPTPPTSSQMRQPKRLITTLKLKPQPVRKSVAVTKEKVLPQPTVRQQPEDDLDGENVRQNIEDKSRTVEVHGSPTSVASWDMSFQTRLQELEQKEKLEDEELKEFELLERMAANTSSLMGNTPARANMYRSQGPSGAVGRPQNEQLVQSEDEQPSISDDSEDEEKIRLEQTSEGEESDLDRTIKEQPGGDEGGQDSDKEEEDKKDTSHEAAVLAEEAEELRDRRDEQKEEDRDSEGDHGEGAAAVSSEALNVDFGDDDSWGDMSNRGPDGEDHDTTLDDSIVAGATPLVTSTPPAKANRLGLSRRGHDSPPSVSEEAAVPFSVEPPPTSELVAKLFPKLKPAKPKVSAEQEEQQQRLHTAAEKSVGEGFQSKVLRDKLAQLETEIERFRQENAALAKLRADREEGMQRLQQEMTEFEKLKSEELKRLEEFRQQEAAKLKKERKLFEQHKKALLQPDKKERAEIEELREQVQELQDELQRREQRWQSSLNRVKNQLQTAQNESQELREELRMMEKQRLEAWSKAETKKIKDHSSVKAFQKQKVTKEKSSDEEEEKKSSVDKSQETSTVPKSFPQTQKRDHQKNLPVPFSQEDWDSDSIPEETPRKMPVAAALEHHPSGAHVGTSDGPKQDVPRRPLQRKKAVKFAGDQDLSLEEEADAVEQLQHADGKTENVLKDGRRVITFSNGTRKEISADGQTLIVTFFNGDIKQIMPDQRVIYYYAEAQTTHTTYPDGLEILQFPNSQMEKHYPDGTKEITFPDQTIKYLFPNGDEESIFQDGTVLRVSKSGDRVVEFANGQREIHTLNYKKREYPDGTVKTVYPDGKQETRYSNGRIRVKDKDGNVIVDKKV